MKYNKPNKSKTSIDGLPSKNQVLREYVLYTHTVQLSSKFTACIGQNAYLARFFARHEELHAFDARVSRLLAQATMLSSYAVRDLYILTCIPT